MNAFTLPQSRTRALRLLVLHRELLVAQSFAAVLASLSPGLQVEATTDTRHAFGTRAEHDVLVADQRLVAPGLRWHEFGRDDGQPVLVVVGDPDNGMTVTAAVAAMRLGARAWVSPDSSPATLLEAVEAVATGQVWLPPELTGSVLQQLVTPRGSPEQSLGLTARERSILELISAGRTTPEIARLLLLSPNTVRTHRQRLFHKLGVHSALEAAAWFRSASQSR
jgi:DNA-binding NarL/FixJ family response regulator